MVSVCPIDTADLEGSKGLWVPEHSTGKWSSRGKLEKLFIPSNRDPSCSQRYVYTVLGIPRVLHIHELSDTVFLVIPTSGMQMRWETKLSSCICVLLFGDCERIHWFFFLFRYWKQFFSAQKNPHHFQLHTGNLKTSTMGSNDRFGTVFNNAFFPTGKTKN